MKHMGQDERNRIEFMLGCGNNVAAIAKALGRSESTISRELLNRRIDSDKHYGCSNRLCARFDDCARTAFKGFRDIRRRNSPRCFESCPDFREAVCVRLNRAPYVCNGCEREHGCPLKKRYYIASGAQANYRGILVNCRSGVHPDEATVRRMSDVLTPAARQGQSVDAIRKVRSEAPSKGLDPNRIGIMGSSAGGHLALLGATSSRRRTYLPIDDIDSLPCNVQWAVAVYPAYSLTDGIDGYNANGGNADDDRLVADFSFDMDTCPVLFIHGDSDGLSAMASVKAWEQLRRMGVQGEVHTLATRPHCFQASAAPGTGSYTYLDRIWEFMNHRKVVR